MFFFSSIRQHTRSYGEWSSDVCSSDLEQARGDRVDSRADIFSTGVLLYEMLTGTWPFRGKTAVDVRHAVLHEEPVAISEAKIGRASCREGVIYADVVDYVA